VGFSLGYSHFFACKKHVRATRRRNLVTTFIAVSNFLGFWFINYPKRPSSIVALYCGGISMRAESANSVSFRDCSLFFDMISVKFTNYRKPIQKTKEMEKCLRTEEGDVFKRRIKEVTWKLSKAREGMLSSNSCIMSHGPSPTPTKIIDKGSALQHKRKELII